VILRSGTKDSFFDQELLRNWTLWNDPDSIFISALLSQAKRRVDSVMSKFLSKTTNPFRLVSIQSLLSSRSKENPSWSWVIETDCCVESPSLTESCGKDRLAWEMDCIRKKDDYKGDWNLITKRFNLKRTWKKFLCSLQVTYKLS